jgi:hypothetical protein
MRSVVIPCSHLNDDNVLGLISLLHDMQGFATLQIAKSGLADSIKALHDPTMRSKALQLFERLKKDSRVVDCKAFGGPCAVNCLCQIELSAAAIVIDDGCGAVAAGNTVPLTQYIVRGPHELLTQADFSSYKIGTRGDWEDHILRPLFRFAKALTIVDYIAGQNFHEFQKSLEWVISVFRETAPAAPVTLFTNVRSLDEQRRVGTWAKAVSVKTIFRRYSPNHNDSLPHDRFLITQSTGLQIGRGLNLRIGEEVRSSSVHLIGNPGDVLNMCFSASAPF